LREDDARHRPPADGGGVPDAARSFRGCARRRGDPLCRARRPLLRHPAHAGPLQDRLLRAGHFRLAQFRNMGRGGVAARAGARQPGVEAAAGELRAAGDGPGDPRGTRRLRRQAHGRRRRAYGFLIDFIPDSQYGPNHMKSHVKAVVIGGGVVGCSVLYHLARAGWTDIMLIERSELTSGSSWHAAGGFHTLNGDPNVAKLQAYTVQLYKELEEVSGQSCSLHLTGGVMMADSPERMDFLRLAHAKGRYLGMDTELITPSEAKAMFPLMDEKNFVGAMWDP